MKSTNLIPIAVLALAAACSDTATSPTSVGRPLFAVSPGSFGSVTTLNAAGSPGGSHIQSGAPIFCTVSSTLVVTCSGGGDYQLNGVGHTNATGHLEATYEATVDCTNKGGNLVEVKSQATGAGTTDGNFKSKNGHLTVTPLTAGRPTDQTFKNAATCPNGNWTKSLAPGDPTLVSFTYTLLFDGFSTAAVFIDQNS